MLWFYTILFLYRVLMRFVLELWVLYICVHGLWVLYIFVPGLWILHYFVLRLWALCFLFCSCTIFFLGCGFYTFLVPGLWVLCIFVLVLWVLYDLVHGLCVRYNFCSWVVSCTTFFWGVGFIRFCSCLCILYIFLFCLVGFVFLFSFFLLFLLCGIYILIESWVFNLSKNMAKHFLFLRFVNNVREKTNKKALWLTL